MVIASDDTISKPGLYFNALLKTRMEASLYMLHYKSEVCMSGSYR